jgi:hypothetical protein
MSRFAAKKPRAEGFFRQQPAVKAAFGKAYKSALLAQGQFSITCFYPCTALISRHYCSFFFNQSFSTFSLPIWL